MIEDSWWKLTQEVVIPRFTRRLYVYKALNQYRFAWIIALRHDVRGLFMHRVSLTYRVLIVC